MPGVAGFSGHRAIFSPRLFSKPMPVLDVLIAGAGPSGLMLALELCRHGVRPRVVDALPGPSPLSRALILHARTLELLD